MFIHSNSDLMVYSVKLKLLRCVTGAMRGFIEVHIHWGEFDSHFAHKAPDMWTLVIYSVAYMLPYGIQTCLGVKPSFLAVTLVMHVLPAAFQCLLSLSLQPAFTICCSSPPFCPFIFFFPSSCVLCTVHPPSSFVCLSSSLSIVLPCSSPFPLCCYPLTSPPSTLLTPSITTTSAAITPHNLGPQIFLFFSSLIPLLSFFRRANNCCQQAPHKIPAWLLLWDVQWRAGSNSH